jgi:rare lipoprotein A (peptidoglycan hydrolase)
VLKSHQAKKENIITPVKVQSSKGFGFFCAFGCKRLVAAGVLFLFLTSNAYAINLTASWYSIQSLKKEGTYKTSKGVMANGKLFNDNAMVCANRIFPMGSLLRVTNLKNNLSVIVRTTDRIGIRFAKSRIDLSKGAFSRIADCEQGIVSCRVERIYE